MTGGSNAGAAQFGLTEYQAILRAAKRTAIIRSNDLKMCGQEAQLPGVGREGAQQHFAVVLDDQIITAPSIDFTKYPEGTDASTGSQILGGFTISSAWNLANELRSGALPISLELISRSPLQVG